MINAAVIGLPESDCGVDGHRFCTAACARDGKHAAGPKASRISFLERKREATKADLLLKFEDGDYHGTCDAAMDLRDIDAELKGLRF